MGITYPTYQDILNRSRGDISSSIPELDPTIFGSYIRGIVDSLGSRSYDVVMLQKQLEKMLFPQTAVGEFLERWAAYEGLTRNAASGADGIITITGTIGGSAPVGTDFSSADGNIYSTDQVATMATRSMGVTTLTRVGTIATATTISPHSISSNMSVVVSGAIEPAYNGTFTVIVTGENTFTYNVAGSPTTPATGTIIARFVGDSVHVGSDSVNDSANGINVNLDSGAKLSLVSSISGVDTDCFVQFTGVTGGADVETNAALLSRTLQSRQNPVANFNPTSIEKEARKVSGVTRVKVKRITPHVGAVTILFVRDDDTDIIPNASEVQDVYDILELILPAQSDPSDLVVTAPTPITTNFAFSSITPDTSTMQTAIENNLVSFYRGVDFETTITDDKYRSAIIDTVDPETGDTLTAFILTTPASDIIIGTNEIGILGTVTF